MVDPSEWTELFTSVMFPPKVSLLSPWFLVCSASIGSCFAQSTVSEKQAGVVASRFFSATMSPAISSKGDYWRELTSPGFEPVRPDKVTPLKLPSRAWAELEVVVRKDGGVRTAAVTRKSDTFKPAAEGEAVAAIKTWTFFPAKKDGKAIEWTVVMMIRVIESKGPDLPAYPILKVDPRYVPGLFSNINATMPGERSRPVDFSPSADRNVKTRPRQSDFLHEQRPTQGMQTALPDGTVRSFGAPSRIGAMVGSSKTIQILPDNVTFDVDVGKAGEIISYAVTDVRFPAFLPAAIEAMHASKLKPGTNTDGEAVRSKLVLTIGNWGPFRGGSQQGVLYLFEVLPIGDEEQIPLESRYTVALEAYDSPVFPTALSRKKKGEAIVDLFLDDAGGVREARIAEASEPEFGYALQAALLSARFEYLPSGNASRVPLSSLRIRRREQFYPAPDAKNFPTATSVRRAVDARITPVPSDKLDAPLALLYEKPLVVSAQLKKAGGEGFAEIEFVVNQEGLVCEPRILDASAPEFGYAAAHAVYYWVYQKPMSGGAPVACSHRLRFDFKDGKLLPVVLKK